MNRHFRHAIADTLRKTGWLLILYSLLRLVFLLYNHGHFPDAGLRHFLGGIRFDLSAICYLNLPIIAALLLPLNVARKKGYRRIVNGCFIAVNSLAIGAALIDTAYFPYVSKRMTADIFSYMGSAQFDFKALGPIFLKEFWWVAGGILLAVALLTMACRRGEAKAEAEAKAQTDAQTAPETASACGTQTDRAEAKDATEDATETTFGTQTARAEAETISFVATKAAPWITCLLLLFATLTGMRGGWQYRPLGIIHAGQYATPQYIPLVLNTPFTLIRTIGKEVMEERNDFPDLTAAEQVFTPVHLRYEAPQLQTPPVKNIVLIILEGVSQEMFRFYHSEEPDYPQYCPFLDSLAAHSLVWNGIANGRRTMEGVPAIVCGIPTLMEHAFIETPFAMNNLQSPVSLLAANGYRTLFFHGAENGSMNFESFCRSIGFAQYYGMNEYPRPEDYDGSWGIPDRSFLRFMAQELHNQQGPFFGCVMTLSSHHPFKLPQDAGDPALYPKGSHPMHTVSAYTDLALREFFQVLSQEPWYDSTLFVITADHAYEGSTAFAQNPYGNYQIPILFYHPAADSASYQEQFMQQTDIMPSLFAYLQLQSPMVCFGQNLFDPQSQPFAVNYLSGIYQIYQEGHLLQFDGEKAVGYYDLKTDPGVRHNLLTDQSIAAAASKEQSAASPKSAADQSIAAAAERSLNCLKAYLQSYSTRMIHNQLTIPSHE